MKRPAADPAVAIVESVRNLPPLPHVALRMNEMLTNAETSARDVERLLSGDPAIASKVLNIANSAYFGVAQRIGTLTHAVMVLGFNTVRNVVFASTLLRSLGASDAQPHDPVRFWKHSTACGAASRLIAERLHLPHVEEYFLIGLLHDVGRVVIRGWRKQEAEEIAQLTAEGWTDVQAESEVLGTTHAQIGAALLQRWQLPSLHVDAVRHHHSPELARENPIAAAIVHVADLLVDAVLLGSDEDSVVPSLSREAWDRLGLQPEDLPELFRGIFDLTEGAASFFNLGAA
ncbi:MAG: HDOD domain-containing protein [Planctomycetes bacterium]|nr:HDOD domain-containing protein [Planctomycetota bacterium]